MGMDGWVCVDMDGYVIWMHAYECVCGQIWMGIDAFRSLIEEEGIYTQGGALLPSDNTQGVPYSYPRGDLLPPETHPRGAVFTPRG